MGNSAAKQSEKDNITYETPTSASAKLKAWSSQRFNKQRWITVLGIIIGVVALLWLIELINFATGGSLVKYGIHPREVHTCYGILLAPFIHGSWGHVAANTLPLVVLTFVTLLRGFKEYGFVTVVAILLGGSGVWLIGEKGSVHIGASGVIYGYFGFLLIVGICEKRLLWVLIGIVTAVVYAGLLWGLVEQEKGVSWEGHLCGGLSGVLCASIVGRCRCCWGWRKKKVPESGESNSNERAPLRNDNSVNANYQSV